MPMRAVEAAAVVGVVAAGAAEVVEAEAAAVDRDRPVVLPRLAAHLRQAVHHQAAHQGLIHDPHSDRHPGVRLPLAVQTDRVPVTVAAIDRPSGRRPLARIDPAGDQIVRVQEIW